MVSTAPAYYPGQVAWLNSAIRFGDTGVVGSTLRIGACTVSGTTPQDGFYYELSDTTFNAVTVKAGVATAVASTAWTRVVASPFTLDTNYHQFEIRWTANGVTFLVDNVVRHTASGGATALTGTLNFPMFAQVTNTSAGVNRVLAVRNIGLGRFGSPDTQAVTLATTATVTESTGNLAALVAFNAGAHTDLLTGILRELRITNQLLQSGLNVNDDLDLFRADPSYTLVS